MGKNFSKALIRSGLPVRKVPPPQIFLPVTLTEKPVTKQHIIDAHKVEKVEGKARPILPDKEGKIDTESDQSSSLGSVCIALVVLLLLLGAAVVAYVVLEWKRQKKTAAQRGSNASGGGAQPTDLDPLCTPDEDLLEPCKDDDTAWTPGEPCLESSPYAGPHGSRGNNSLDRKLRSRRLCLCVCCPPLVQPLMKKAWRVKQSLMKSSDDADAQHSLRLMAEGMKQMKGHHHHLHHPASPSSPTPRLTPNPRRRHRKSHKRSQSLPAPSKKSTPRRQISRYQHNRSFCSQAALMMTKRRSQSVSPGQSRHPQADVRQHRHGGAHRSRREGLEQQQQQQQHKSGRPYVQKQPQRHYSSRSKSSGRRRVETTVGDAPPRSDTRQDPRCMYPDSKFYRYYFNNDFDCSETGSERNGYWERHMHTHSSPAPGLGDSLQGPKYCHQRTSSVCGLDHTTTTAVQGPRGGNPGCIQTRNSRTSLGSDNSDGARRRQQYGPDPHFRHYRSLSGQLPAPYHNIRIHDRRSS